MQGDRNRVSSWAVMERKLILVSLLGKLALFREISTIVSQAVNRSSIFNGTAKPMTRGKSNSCVN
jgi:hypothetical protein